MSSVNSVEAKESKIKEYIGDYYHQVPDNQVDTILEILTNESVKGNFERLSVHTISYFGSENPDEAEYTRHKGVFEVDAVTEEVSRYYLLLQFPCMYDYYFNCILGASWDGTLYDYELEALLNGNVDIQLLHSYIGDKLDKALALNLVKASSLHKDREDKKALQRDGLQNIGPDNYFTYQPRFPYLINRHHRSNYYSLQFHSMSKDFYDKLARYSNIYCTWAACHAAFSMNPETKDSGAIELFSTHLLAAIKKNGNEWCQLAYIRYAIAFAYFIREYDTIKEPSIHDKTSIEELRLDVETSLDELLAEENDGLVSTVREILEGYSSNEELNEEIQSAIDKLESY